MEAIEVRLLLQPLQGKDEVASSGNTRLEPSKASKPTEERQAETIKQLQNRIAKLEKGNENGKQSKSGFSDRSRSTGKGSGKSYAPRDKVRLPKEMLDNDCVGTTPAGEGICYAFNMNGCDRASSGRKCPRGWHVCAVKGCFATDRNMRNHK